MRLQLGILSIGLSILIFAGCSSPQKMGATVGQQLSDREYNDLYMSYTKNDKKYSGFNQDYDVSVTLVSSELQTAILQRKSNTYLWDENEAQTERESLFQENSNSTKFIVVLFTPKTRLSDLDKPNSIWKMYLDVNGERYKGTAKKIKDPIEKILPIYPSHNRFSVVYEVVFKVPLKSAEEYPMQFTITSSLGTSDFEFKAR